MSADAGGLCLRGGFCFLTSWGGWSGTPPPPPPAGIRLPSEGARPSPTGQKEAAPGPRGRCEGPDWLPRGWPRTWLGLSLGAVVQGPGKPCARCPWAPPARVSRRVGHRLGGVAARQAVGTDFCKTVLNTKQAGQAVSLRNQQLCGDWSGKPSQGALPVLRGQRDTHTHTHTRWDPASCPSSRRQHHQCRCQT